MMSSFCCSLSIILLHCCCFGIIFFLLITKAKDIALRTPPRAVFFCHFKPAVPGNPGNALAGTGN